ncbi:sialin-like [Phymastichus coffea]|uniref:sialin-like n=1 Tax=Phymastichus coffea TaxID=108790 RepID=UPI00273B606E|nr:sialin-like [Phymastichus coffea]XP_058793651.1 sialin-like [Phymastichus coffea]
MSLKNCLKIPQRWIIVILGFVGLFNEYAMRICLSIAITEMTLPPNDTIIVTDGICSGHYDGNTTYSVHVNRFNITKYDWSEHTQGLILSSFYWGYIFTNLLGGIISQKFGGKHTLGLSILFTSLFTLITPTSIYWGSSTALIVLRLVMGLGEGTAYPALNDLLAHWIPENERSKAGSMVFSGAPLGTIFGMLGSGVILQNSQNGWPMVFYFYGTVGLASFLLNAAFCYSKPSDNPFITEEELSYLKRKLKNKHSNLPSTPWRCILKSPPVWALIVVSVGNAWGFLTIISDMPKYMSSVLKFSVQDNGYLSSIPYLSMWIGSTVTCWIADKVITKQIVSITGVRKIGCTIASLGPAIFLVAASYAGCDGFLAITLLTLGLTLMGCAFFSLVINALDLSPNYASSIMGLVNGISVIGGMLSPYIVGVITPNQTISEWRIVFWIVFALFITSNFVYLIYGSADVQEWNNPNFKNQKILTDEDNVAESFLPVNEKF